MDTLITNCFSKVKQFIISLLLVNLLSCGTGMAVPPITGDESQKIIVQETQSIIGRYGSSTSLTTAGRQK